MKKILVVFLILTLVLTVGMIGCKKEVSSGVYHKYYFDVDQGTFTQANVFVEFGEKMKSFHFSANDILNFYGEVVKTSNGFALNVSQDVSAAMLDVQTLKEEEPDKYALIKEYVDAVSLNQQLYSSEEYLFSSYDIALSKRLDSDRLASVEGVYDYVNDSSTRYRLAGGYVYSISVDDKGVTTEKEAPSGRYYLQERILTIVRIDNNGKDIVYEGKTQKISYFFATITYPDNNDITLGEDAYSKSLKEELDLISGKTIAVMASAYYAK